MTNLIRSPLKGTQTLLLMEDKLNTTCIEPLGLVVEAGKENLSDENLVNHIKRICDDSSNVLRETSPYLDYVGGVIE